jgi:hypothetical protein
MPVVRAERIIRLALDINVLVADVLASMRGRRGTAAAVLVDMVRRGTCRAGPVQFVTSLPVIENYANVLRRHLGYSAVDADEKAWILQQYSLEGPVSDLPYVAVHDPEKWTPVFGKRSCTNKVLERDDDSKISHHALIGAGYIPFESEEQLRRSVAAHAAGKAPSLPSPACGGGLGWGFFHETQDDRYVLETALAGRADILATSDLQGFAKGPAITFQRDDVVLFPVADRKLVIGSPQFGAHWLGEGIVPDAGFIADHPEDFIPQTRK